MPSPLDRIARSTRRYPAGGDHARTVAYRQAGRARRVAGLGAQIGDGADGDTGFLQRNAGRIGAVIRGGDHRARSHLHAVAPQINPRGIGQHDARPVVAGETPADAPARRRRSPPWPRAHAKAVRAAGADRDRRRWSVTRCTRPMRLSGNQPNAVVRGSSVTSARRPSVVQRLAQPDALRPALDACARSPPAMIRRAPPVRRTARRARRRADAARAAARPAGPAPITSTSQCA